MISNEVAHYLIYGIEQLFYMVKTACILTVVIVAITGITLMLLYNIRK